MKVRTALRSVVLAVVFLTAVSLYAFHALFRRLEAVDEARRPEDQHLPPYPRPAPVRSTSPRCIP